MSWPIVIITRFNLYIPFRELNSTSPNLEPKWLEGRMKLFEDYCQPSIAAQTYKNFRWLVMIDPKTPQDIVDRLNSMPHVEATPMEKFMHWDVAEVVREWTPAEEWILTVGLDSDDMLHKDFLKELVEVVTANPPTERMFYTYPYGYSVENRRFYRRLYPDNQFYAFAEKWADCETVLCADHDDMAKTAPIRYLHKKPRWAAVIHGTNVANFNFGIRDLGAKASDFGIRQELIQTNGVLDLFDVPFSWTKEMIRRTRIVRNVKKLVRVLTGRKG